MNTLWDPNLCQDVKRYHHSRSFPCSSQSIPVPTNLRGNCYCDFFQRRLVLLILELHVSGIMQYELCVWLLSNSMVFLRIISDVFQSFLFIVE